MRSTCEFPEAPMEYCGCNGCLDPESKEVECLDYNNDSDDCTELTLEQATTLWETAFFK